MINYGVFTLFQITMQYQNGVIATRLNIASEKIKKIKQTYEMCVKKHGMVQNGI